MRPAAAAAAVYTPTLLLLLLWKRVRALLLVLLLSNRPLVCSNLAGDAGEVTGNTVVVLSPRILIIGELGV